MNRQPLAGLALAVGLTASAADVQVRLTPQPAAASCMTTGWLVGRGSDGEGLVRVPFGDGQTVYRMSLAGEHAWELVAESEGCWSETVVVGPAESGEVPLGLYRAGTIEGLFDVEGEPARELRGFIFPLRSRESDMNATTSSGMPIACRLDFPQWKCTVPADTPFDVRLDVRGFGAIHYWSVVADRGSVRQLEPRRLHAGASVAGWIQDQKGVPMPGAKVTLYPLEEEVSRLDRQRMIARRRATTANARGFFQFSGLEPGPYRLVSEARGLSPATVPELRVREGESLIWPMAIAHAPFATLEISLYPSRDRNGHAWVVELSDEMPLHLDPPPRVNRPAGADGRWTAGPLRAGVYRLFIRDRDGSELERMDVDLSEGGPKAISLNVRSIVVHGLLRMGDEPLSADVDFTNFSGKIVRASAAEDGEFEAVFPTGGQWTPAISYPREGGTTLTLDAVEIDPRDESPARIELLVPGGRIRGHAVRADDTSERVGVHVLHQDQLVAQVITPASGKFDFIGIKAGTYMIGAEGFNSSTPRPVELQLEENEVKEIRLILAPVRRISGTVLTPLGTPASGAVVHILRDDGRAWRRVVTDVAGRFEYPLAAGIGHVSLVVLTYAYPSAIARIPADAPPQITIILKPEGGILRIRNGQLPYVQAREVVASIRAFYFPDPFGRFNGGIHLEPGTYLVCPDRGVESACRTVTIAPAADLSVDFKPQDEKEKPSS